MKKQSADRSFRNKGGPAPKLPGKTGAKAIRCLRSAAAADENEETRCEYGNENGHKS